MQSEQPDNFQHAVAKESLSQVKLLRLLDKEVASTFLGLLPPSENWPLAPSPNNYAVIDHSSFNARAITEATHAAIFADVRHHLEKKLAKFVDREAGGRFVLSKIAAVRYEPNGHLGEHTDATPRHSRFRRHSIVLYLNENYTGGYTYFRNLNARYRGVAGEALIFPSYFLHSGESVKSGVKYILIAFLCDPATSPPAV
jgi:hypothetical protein